MLSEAPERTLRMTALGLADQRDPASSLARGRATRGPRAGGAPAVFRGSPGHQRLSHGRGLEQGRGDSARTCRDRAPQRDRRTRSASGEAAARHLRVDPRADRPRGRPHSAVPPPRVGRSAAHMPWPGFESGSDLCAPGDSGFDSGWPSYADCSGGTSPSGSSSSGMRGPRRSLLPPPSRRPDPRGCRRRGRTPRSRSRGCQPGCSFGCSVMVIPPTAGRGRSRRSRTAGCRHPAPALNRSAGRAARPRSGSFAASLLGVLVGRGIRRCVVVVTLRRLVRGAVLPQRTTGWGSRLDGPACGFGGPGLVSGVCESSVMEMAYPAQFVANTCCGPASCMP